MRSLSFLSVFGLLLLAGCTVESNDAGGAATVEGEDYVPPEAMGDGEVVTADVQGSSTVFPIARTAADAVFEDNELYDVKIARTGSGAGISALIKNECDIANASRRIKDSELKEAEEAGIEITEVPVALDGIAVVVHPENDWIDAITVADLKKIFEPGSSINKWSDLNPDYPDTDLELYTPDTVSGTFAFFTEEIVGEENSQREDTEKAENDNVIVNGVSGNKGGLGYFGYSYLANNSDKLKGLAISTTDDVADAVAPTVESIESGDYKPLARPLFIYLNNERVKNNAAAAAYVKKIVSDKGQELIAEEDMVSVNADRLAESRKQVEELLGE